MAPTRRRNNRLPPRPPILSSSFIPAISTVAVAQICESVGYTTAEPAAIQSLSSIAALYIQTLGTSAASIANSRGRTQSNILDLIRAMEHLSVSTTGFAGGSDPTRPLLQSSVVMDLRWFVASVEEIPFAKPIRKAVEIGRVEMASFREEGFAHVPRWLPSFPEGWWRRRRRRIEERKERGEGKKRWEDGGGGGGGIEMMEEEEELDMGKTTREQEPEEVVDDDDDDSSTNGGVVVSKATTSSSWVRELMEEDERGERISFKLGVIKRR